MFAFTVIKRNPTCIYFRWPGALLPWGAVDFVRIVRAFAMAFRKTIELSARPRGVHLVTREIVAALPELGGLRVGFLHLLLQHTSAALFLGENADPDVRRDFDRWLDRAAPDGDRLFVHTAEGPDDMPAHIKSGLLGVGLLLPVTHGRLDLGTWQGVYLGEHRDHGGSRHIVATAWEAP